MIFFFYYTDETQKHILDGNLVSISVFPLILHTLTRCHTSTNFTLLMKGSTRNNPPFCFFLPSHTRPLLPPTC